MIYNTQIKNCLSCSVLLGVALLACAFGTILIVDFDGWGIFLLNMLISGSSQLFLALLFTAACLVLLQAIHVSYGDRYISLFILTSIFTAGLILALPVITLMQNRSLDVYDILQTFFLFVLFILVIILLRLAVNQASQASPDDPKPYDLPPRSTQPIITPIQKPASISESRQVSNDPSVRNAAQRTQPPRPASRLPQNSPSEKPSPTPAGQPTPRRQPPQSTSQASQPGIGKKEADAYNELIQLVQGDEDIARRLFELERKNSPNGTPLSWIEDAIRSLLRHRQ